MCVYLFLQSMHQKSQGQYASASKKATIAFVLAILTLVLTLLSWVVVVGLLVGFNRDNGPCRSVSHSTYEGYGEC